MKAIYITYAIEEHKLDNKIYKIGDIVDVEMKIAGLACKVADRGREDWQSVLRCSLDNDEDNQNISVLSYGKVINRNAMIGDKIILREDICNSNKCVFRIEDV